jgi:hypothetical protein
MMRRILFVLLVAYFHVNTICYPVCGEPLHVKGVTVIPHVQSTQLRYREPADFDLGARVQIFLQNTGDAPLRFSSAEPVLLRGKTPGALLESDEWAWHDFPEAWPGQDWVLPSKAMTVWSWNGKRSNWGDGTSADIRVGEKDTPRLRAELAIDSPSVWLASVTFLGEKNSPFPHRVVYHITNHSRESLQSKRARLWLPESHETWRTFIAQEWHERPATFPEDGWIPAGDMGGGEIITGTLPLTYCVLEVQLENSRGEVVSVWSHTRIKREAFDISGGWISSTIGGKSSLTLEPYLKTLHRMHVNTGHIGEVSGYTDNEDLYNRYPLKLFNKLDNFQHFDNDAMLPRIHAVEFLGEPQYGGGRPVPPMEVWQALRPYQPTRLPTTVTHSEERIWRFYAGLSDYPHYDAYRVCAPSPDLWRQYDRWGGASIRWGAPLETIGDMTRSLRELNRPAPIAYWSQGAHSGWDHYGGRERTSPTAAELRVQAYHALACRITSLYWFNLSLKSILAFPDLIDPITTVGREIRLLEDFYLEGAAYHYERIVKKDRPAWDTYVIASPRGALLFVLDLEYKADLDSKVFSFGEPRHDTIPFPLPAYLRAPNQVLHIDADTVEPVSFQAVDGGVILQRAFRDVDIFAVSRDKQLEPKLRSRLRELIDREASFSFDPGHSPTDLETLRALLR